MALPGLVLPRAGDSSSGSAQSSSFDGLADRMNEFRKKKKKQDDDAAAAVQAEADKKKADDKAKADKAAEDKKNSLPSKVVSGIKDIFQANTEGDQQRRVAQGQPADYAEQQKQKKATADAFKGKTSDEFGRADSGLNLSPQEFEQRRQHYADSGINVDQLQKDKAEYEALAKRRAAGESLVKLTKDGAITEGAKRYDAERDKVKKAESTYQRNQKAAAGAETTFDQAERGFVRGAGEPLIQVPSSVETLAGSALQAVAPDGSRIQKAGDKLHDKGKTDRQDLATRLVTSGYAPQQNDSQFISGVSEGTGSLVASLAAARLAKGLPFVGGSTKIATTVPAAVFGVNQGADQELAADKAGKSDVQSFVTGLVAGTAEAGLEKVGLDKFLGASGGPVKEAATRMITEGLQEMTQSLAQSGVNATYQHVNVQQAIQQAVTEGGLGSLVGGGASVPMSIAENLEKQGVSRDDALEAAMNAQDRMEAVANDEKAKLSGQAPKDATTAPELPGAPTLPTAEGAVSVSASGDTPAAPAQPKAGTDSLKLPEDKPAELNHVSTVKGGPATDNTATLTAAKQADSGPGGANQAGGVPSPTPKSDFSESTATGSQSPKITSDQNTQSTDTLHNDLPEAFKSNAKAIADLQRSFDKLEAAGPVKGATMPEKTPMSKEAVDVIRELSARDQKELADVRDEVKLIERRKRLGRPLDNEDRDMLDYAAALEARAEKIAVARSKRRQAEKGDRAPAAGDQSGTDGGAGAGVRAPAAVGPSGTMRSDEKNKASGDQSVAAADGSRSQSAPRNGQGDAGGVSGAKPTDGKDVRRPDAGTGRTGADTAGSSANVQSRPDSRDKPAAASAQSEGRQQALKAIEDHKALSEGRVSERPAEEMAKLVDQLNKAAQAGAILRRGDLKSKKAAGMFTRKGGDGKDPKTAKDPRIMLQDAVIKDPQQYATVLAHELSHAMEFYINGNTSKTLSMFDLTDEEKVYVTSELKHIVDELEGADIAQARPEYFYKPTEMLARYVEMRLLFPGKAEIMAPKMTEAYERLVMKEPMIQDLMAALDNNIDKGAVNFTPSFLKDVQQIYRKRLGKHVGDIAYNAEVRRRAEINRSSQLIAQLIKRKFKGIKDKPEQLFRAAEAVLVTKKGTPEFGTHDFLWDVEQRDLEKAVKQGYSIVEKKVALTDKQTRAILQGETVADADIKFEYDLAKVRYTPEQAEKIFNDLSPAGQQLIKDFTAAKEEAKDEFNRELMKDLYHIDSKIEGWVHHFFEGKPMGNNNKATLKHKIAAAKKQRKGAEGYVEDFQKATEKALIELDRNEINNGFIRDQLARISKPIAKGEKPEKGWVEVVADEKGGLRLPGEGMQIMVKPDEGKAVKIPEKRYQVPEDLARHYREIRDIPAETNMAAKALNRIAKYWTLNVLVHPGTVSTNFISGGLQYGAKIVNDFYMDLLTANFGMSRTRHNLIAPLQALTPGGWTNAPDWLYGGYRAGTQAGGMSNYAYDTKIDKGIDQYGDKMLYAMGLVETYWKKTIALSEGSKLKGASNRRITERLQADELKMVDALNQAIDFYAFDYDNKPLWLNRFERGGGKVVKPFMTYPYKYTKFVTEFAAAGFDRSQPWQTRVSKVLTITTIVAFIAALYHDREEEKTTPDGTEKTPLSLSPNGRVYVGKAKDGKEIFVRTAKYPFFNLTSMGRSLIDRNGKDTMGLLNEMYSTVGPGFDLFMLATGRADQFDQYTPASERIGEMVGSFIPGFRVLSDAGKMLDEKQRGPKTFVQGVGSQLPIFGSEDDRVKWRGDVRTIKIPDETGAGRDLTKSTRTVTEREMTNNRSDVLLSLLTGVYLRRIDPKEAKAQQLREERDMAEKTIRDQLAAGNDADAEMLAKEHGFTISNDTLKYYYNKRKRGDVEK